MPRITTLAAAAERLAHDRVAAGSLGGVSGRAATAKWIEYAPTGRAQGLDEEFHQCNGERCFVFVRQRMTEQTAADNDLQKIAGVCLGGWCVILNLIRSIRARLRVLPTNGFPDNSAGRTNRQLMRRPRLPARHVVDGSTRAA
jgi:hypothetical protein